LRRKSIPLITGSIDGERRKRCDEDKETGRAAKGETQKYSKTKKHSKGVRV
jgi:hypothetical protein